MLHIRNQKKIEWVQIVRCFRGRYSWIRNQRRRQRLSVTLTQHAPWNVVQVEIATLNYFGARTTQKAFQKLPQQPPQDKPRMVSRVKDVNVPLDEEVIDVSTVSKRFRSRSLELK